MVEVVLGGGSGKESTAETRAETEGLFRKGSAVGWAQEEGTAEELEAVGLLLRLFGVAFS